MHKLHPLPPPARGYGEDQRQRDVGEQEENAEQDRIADKRGVVPAAQVLSVHLDEQQSKFLLVQGWPKAITVQNILAPSAPGPFDAHCSALLRTNVNRHACVNPVTMGAAHIAKAALMVAQTC
eukprot:scaffold79682_cov22-Tisochrysis_lutea.AAC.1